MSSSSAATSSTSSSSAKIAVITGANKGIGLETARQLAALGYTVVIGSRDAARGAEAAASLVKAGFATADSVQLDVTDQSSIDAAAAYVKKKYGRVDALVNNAGVGGNHYDPTTLTVASAKQVFDTNFFGVVGVTTAFLPLVRAAEKGNGRIVMVSSLLGSLGERARPSSEFLAKFTPTAYDASKAAVNMYTLELAQVLKEEGIKVNTSHPGLVKTDMNPTGMGIEVAEGAETSVWLATLPADGPTGGFFHKQIHLQW